MFLGLSASIGEHFLSDYSVHELGLEAKKNPVALIKVQNSMILSLMSYLHHGLSTWKQKIKN